MGTKVAKEPGTSETQVIRKLLHDLKERRNRDAKDDVRRRMFLWNWTILLTYGTKRLLDILASFCAILCFLPVFAVIALAVKLTSPGPIIFKQKRVGRYGRIFDFYKFRSMYIDAEARKQALLAKNQSGDGVIFKMKNDPRITSIGRFLRRSSLDELPQLFNVLEGDMSLVGPRPPLPSEVREYSLEDRKRLNVIPGITCIWQVSGRSDIPFTQQVQLDKQYIRSQSIWNDILILLKTVPAVLMGKGAY